MSSVYRNIVFCTLYTTVYSIMFSPRRKYRPQMPDEWVELVEAARQDENIILWDNQVDWRGKVLSSTKIGTDSAPPP